MMDTEMLAEIRAFRHHVRLGGCWGGCYEVACFIEHRFGYGRRDGVFRLADGRPVFLHSWNETPGAGILDGTADQFGFGWDVARFSAGSAEARFYTQKYTRAHNPRSTPWLAGAAYVGEPDRDFWERQHASRNAGPGWWLADPQAYHGWLCRHAAQYPRFAEQVHWYREQGYPI